MNRLRKFFARRFAWQPFMPPTAELALALSGPGPVERRAIAMGQGGKSPAELALDLLERVAALEVAQRLANDRQSAALNRIRTLEGGHQ